MPDHEVFHNSGITSITDDERDDALHDGRHPVWEDSDDERLQVSLTSIPRLRKLRKTEAEDLGRESPIPRAAEWSLGHWTMSARPHSAPADWFFSAFRLSLFGGAAVAAALFFTSGIPRIQKDILNVCFCKAKRPSIDRLTPSTEGSWYGSNLRKRGSSSG